MSREVLERLLNLFPVGAIQELAQHADGERMTKAEAIAEIAAASDVERVLDFTATNFGFLHQHVHVFERDPNDRAPNVAGPFEEAPFSSEQVGDEAHFYYLLAFVYHLVLDSPLEHAKLDFAWPVKLVVAPNHTRVHFTIMAKSVRSYVEEGRPVIRSAPRPTENDLLSGLPARLGAAPRDILDLNKGVKALWEADEFDAPSVQYKRARATSRDVMDESYMVKKDDPSRYAQLVDKPLLDTILLLMGADPCIKYFAVDPTAGRLAFRRYSASSDCVDGVIRRILKAN